MIGRRERRVLRKLMKAIDRFLFDRPFQQVPDDGWVIKSVDHHLSEGTMVVILTRKGNLVQSWKVREGASR